MSVERSAKVPTHHVTAAVLAGGGSTRFGSDKALARLPGEHVTFLERVVTVGRSVAGDVVIVAPNRPGYQSASASILADVFPGEGPAGGVLTALQTVTTEWLLVLSCDQPFLEARDLERLLAVDRTARATAFQSATGGIHPLPCAVLVEPCRAIVEAAFAEGCRSLKQLLARCGVTTISVDGKDIEQRLRDIDSPAELPGSRLE